MNSKKLVDAEFLDSNLARIADVIREKTGEDGQIDFENFANKISSIGGSVPPQTYMADCSTNKSVATKEATVSNANFPSELTDGVCVGVRFSKGNSASEITLNVNNTGAKDIITKDYEFVGEWSSQRIMFFTYDADSDAWIHECEQTATKERPGVVQLSSDVSSTDDTKAATIGAVHSVQIDKMNKIASGEAMGGKLVESLANGNVQETAYQFGGFTGTSTDGINIPSAAQVKEYVDSVVLGLNTLLGTGELEEIL